jgi:hypothetical protein
MMKSSIDFLQIFNNTVLILIFISTLDIPHFFTWSLLHSLCPFCRHWLSRIWWLIGAMLLWLLLLIDYHSVAARIAVVLFCDAIFDCGCGGCNAIGADAGQQGVGRGRAVSGWRKSNFHHKTLRYPKKKNFAMKPWASFVPSNNMPGYPQKIIKFPTICPTGGSSQQTLCLFRCRANHRWRGFLLLLQSNATGTGSDNAKLLLLLLCGRTLLGGGCGQKLLPVKGGSRRCRSGHLLLLLLLLWQRLCLLLAFGRADADKLGYWYLMAAIGWLLRRWKGKLGSRSSHGGWSGRGGRGGGRAKVAVGTEIWKSFRE